MNSDVKTDQCQKLCIGCESYTDKYCDENSFRDGLCEECDNKYEDKTGYCSLFCCLGYGCDESC